MAEIGYVIQENPSRNLFIRWPWWQAMLKKKRSSVKEDGLTEN
jgi:hypothetical protein